MASTSAAQPSSAMEESRNLLEMPDELMANILQRLGAVEILNSAWEVCTTWRRICKDPAMWKVIDIQKTFFDLHINYDIQILTKRAVDLSCGQLIDISIEGFGTNKLLDHIVLGSHKLKRLSITNCYEMTGSGFGRAVKGAPQLEELHLSFISDINPKDIEVIGQNCPQLRSLYFFYCWNEENSCDSNALAIANNMPELRHLKLFDFEMTNYGLEAILNGCPHLQSLDVSWCCDLKLDGSLGKLCMERFKDFKHESLQK